MEWAILIEMLFEMIRESIENRGRDVAVKRLNNPGIAEAWRLRRLIRSKTELRGRELHAEVQAGMAYLADMDADEVTGLVDEAVAVGESQ